MFFSKFLKYRFFLLFLTPFFINLSSIATELSKTEDSSYLEYKNEYIIGPGDTLGVDFKGLNIFSGNYKIFENGFLKLPEIGEINAAGKTMDQLKEILETKYSEFIYNPEIELSISNYRTLNITLRGELNKTGLFKMNYSIDENYAPRLFNLIQLGEGITPNADLRNIEVIRKNPEINGGGMIKTKIDLISLLESGNQSVNIILRDGDDVFVPKSDTLLLDQLVSVNKSNLTPDTIAVFINGNVIETGLFTLKQGVSLVDAIYASGGLKSMSGKIEFVRVSRSDKPEKRLINFKSNAEKGSRDNPILVSGDIIFVRRNLAGKASSVILDYSQPIVNSYGIYKIFD